MLSSSKNNNHQEAVGVNNYANDLRQVGIEGVRQNQPQVMVDDDGFYRGHNSLVEELEREGQNMSCW